MSDRGGKVVMRCEGYESSSSAVIVQLIILNEEICDGCQFLIILLLWNWIFWNGTNVIANLFSTVLTAL